MNKLVFGVVLCVFVTGTMARTFAILCKEFSQLKVKILKVQ